MGKALKRAAAAGVAAAGLYALYRWQPQRIQLWQRAAPEDDPPLDPASEFLFSPDASVAVVTAHPDDAEFYAGGTLTRLHSAGARITLIVATDGDKGYYPGSNAEETRAKRRQEQVESARAYSCEDVIFLGHRDGRLRNTRELQAQIEGAVIASEAQYAMSFDPVFPPRVQHADHLRTGAATALAIRAVPNVEFLLQFSTRAPNFAVEITGVWPAKRQLLAHHKSQFSGKRLQMIERIVHSRAARDGALAGVPLAEGFRVWMRNT